MTHLYHLQDLKEIVIGYTFCLHFLLGMGVDDLVS